MARLSRAERIALEKEELRNRVQACPLPAERRCPGCAYHTPDGANCHFGQEVYDRAQRGFGDRHETCLYWHRG
jgi:hypothetical protein